MIGGAIFGSILGGLGGFIVGVAGIVQYAALVGGILGYVAGTVWSMFVVRMMLRKKYSGFRLALVPVVSD